MEETGYRGNKLSKLYPVSVAWGLLCYSTDVVIAADLVSRLRSYISRKPPLKTQTRIISALWLWMLANYLDRVAISVAGPSIMQSLALSPASFGIILSSFGVGYLLSQIPGGLIAD